MILSPLENTAELTWTLQWRQVRPFVTQIFGINKEIYRQFGLVGHNGIDLRCKVGTPVFSPCEGEVKTGDEGEEGYGLHVKIREKIFGREIVIAHLSELAVKNGQYLKLGELIGLSGDTGFSTGPHLHIGLRFLVRNDDKNIWKWLVKEYSNGFKGYRDILGSMITFKGTLDKNSIF